MSIVYLGLNVGLHRLKLASEADVKVIVEKVMLALREAFPDRESDGDVEVELTDSAGKLDVGDWVEFPLADRSAR